MEIKIAPVDEQVKEMDKGYDVSRRRFFQLAGGIAGAGLLLSACHKTTPNKDVYIGSGDTALLNYLYILQQLEAAFYTQAFATPYYGLTSSDYDLLKDVRDQEIAHREFFKRLLGADAVPDISTDFSLVTFADRTSVLTYAARFEDMVISAMNGAVRLFTNTDHVLSISKMITVEARHSAYFRNQISLNDFSNGVVDTNGLGQSATPASILTEAQTFIHTTFDKTQLPN
ncbi:MAG: hypothetical protein JWQ38_933 [Flavipsychrobacter sp.]|nr:hypothetical protein [Flavipsychrobacter sp.]